METHEVVEAPSVYRDGPHPASVTTTPWALTVWWINQPADTLGALQGILLGPLTVRILQPHQFLPSLGQQLPPLVDQDGALYTGGQETTQWTLTRVQDLALSLTVAGTGSIHKRTARRWIPSSIKDVSFLLLSIEMYPENDVRNLGGGFTELLSVGDKVSV